MIYILRLRGRIAYNTSSKRQKLTMFDDKKKG